jgi:hypothetical protein
MSKFNVTVTAKVEARDQYAAKYALERAVSAGRQERFFESAQVTDVTEVDEITISRADLAAMITQCVADALAQVQAGA